MKTETTINTIMWYMHDKMLISLSFLCWLLFMKFSYIKGLVQKKIILELVFASIVSFRISWGYDSTQKILAPILP